jgi:hypothetical protein
MKLRFSKRHNTVYRIYLLFEKQDLRNIQVLCQSLTLSKLKIKLLTSSTSKKNLQVRKILISLKRTLSFWIPKRNGKRSRWRSLDNRILQGSKRFRSMKNSGTNSLRKKVYKT